MTYNLMNAEKQHNEYPSTFWIPDAAIRANLKPDQIIKLVFQGGMAVERMWVKVTENTSNGRYKGILDNDAISDEYPKYGETIEFGPEHVINLYESGLGMEIQIGDRNTAGS